MTIGTLIFPAAIEAAALPMTIVLGGLIIYALVAGRASLRDGLWMPLGASLIAFVVSRVLGPQAGSLVGFSFLNLVGYVGLALVILHFVGEPEQRGSLRKMLVGRAFRQLGKQSGYLALAGAVVFLVAGSGGSTFGQILAGAVAFALIGATIRLVAFVFHAAYRCPNGLRVVIYAGASVVTASWLLLAVTPLLRANALITVIGLSRLFDMGSMVFLLAALLSGYIRTGRQYKEDSKESHAQMEATKEELTKLSNLASDIYEDSSDVIKKQKEQTLQFMKKVESLQQILQIGITIQKHQNLDEVLSMIVEMVRDHVGFNTITLRLLNPKTQNFETEAHVGLSEEARKTVENYRIPKAEYKKMIKPQYRVSKSYFIRNTERTYDDSHSEGDASVLVEDTWGAIDMLIVPLLSDDRATIGYLSVENPENPKLSVADVIETIENIATLATIAIRNARFFKELEAKNRKLTTYAEKLSSLNKMKSNFVATISHEFRTPLTSIKAYCETLLKNADEVDRELLKQFLMVIDEESTRLMTLIDDILDFSQLESGAMKFERKPAEVNEVVAAAVGEVKKNFDVKHVTLHQELPPNGLVIHIDAELVKQLIVNLLHNASKFTKDGGNVWLKVVDQASAVHVTVEDDGIGIPETQLGQVFDEFHQADSSNTRRHGGTGLGLAICKNIVEWHDGRIWVENVSGRGARFVAVIPKKEVVVKCHVTNVSSTVRRFEIERFLELLVENTATICRVRRASIMLLDKPSQLLRIECAIGLDEEIVSTASVKLGEGIAGRVAKTGETMLVKDIEKDSRTERSNNELMYGSKAFLSVPIKAGNDIIGVVNIASPIGRQEFTDEDAELLEIVSDRFAIALVKLKRFAASSVNYEQVRETFKSILEAKRYIDRKDDEVIYRCVLNTAEAMGLTEEQKVRLKYVLNVYDLGLSKVGYHIVKKPHDLSPNDRLEIERHTEIGRELLSSIEPTPDVGEIVLHHHENYDGSGYPGGVAGNSIPIEARILRVADSLRALISQRPYQRQYSLDEAKDVIRHRSGSFFDPDVVTAFLKAVDLELQGTVRTKSPIGEQHN